MFDIDSHIQRIIEVYGAQCQAMLDAIKSYLPADISCTTPEGGMFLWGRLPETVRAMELFDRAVRHGVVFVPGEPFYTMERASYSFRLNFSCVDESTIQTGMARLAEAFKEHEGQTHKDHPARKRV